MNPDTPQWGPALWRILHALVERTGGRTDLRYALDETRLWYNFLTGLRYSIPCTTCKTHYSEYILGHNIDPEFMKQGADRRAALRKWFYDFHQSVNARTGKTFETPVDDLATLYGREAYTDHMFVKDKEILVEHMRRAMFIQMMKRDDMLRAIRPLEELWLLIR